MNIKDAEKKYGKDIIMKVWENTSWLLTVKCKNSPEGLDIPDYEWERAIFLLKNEE